MVMKPVSATCSACGEPRECHEYKHVRLCIDCLDGIEEFYADLKAEEDIKTKIPCPICGKPFKRLATHLGTHDIDPLSERGQALLRRAEDDARG